MLFIFTAIFWLIKNFNFMSNFNVVILVIEHFFLTAITKILENSFKLNRLNIKAFIELLITPQFKRKWWATTKWTLTIGWQYHSYTIVHHSMVSIWFSIRYFSARTASRNSLPEFKDLVKPEFDLSIKTSTFKKTRPILSFNWASRLKFSFKVNFKIF